MAIVSGLYIQIQFAISMRDYRYNQKMILAAGLSSNF